jgi:hypothetical protein
MTHSPFSSVTYIYWQTQTGQTFLEKTMNRRQRGRLLSLLLIIIVLNGGDILIRFGLLSPSRQALQVVEEFYEYEQLGDYSRLWELFHSSIKEDFPKGGYIKPP